MPTKFRGAQANTVPDGRRAGKVIASSPLTPAGGPDLSVVPSGTKSTSEGFGRRVHAVGRKKTSSPMNARSTATRRLTQIPCGLRWTTTRLAFQSSSAPRLQMEETTSGDATTSERRRRKAAAGREASNPADGGDWEGFLPSITAS